MLLVSRFLIRRVVNPLAEVIAAARAVADGKLDARVPVTGPGDLRTLSDSFNQMASALEKNDNERRQMLAILRMNCVPRSPSFAAVSRES